MTDLDFVDAPSENENLFCHSIPTLPRAWDSTMLGLAKTCWRKFKYIIIDGYSPTGFASHLAFGIAYHKALETFDKDKAKGATYDEALNNAIRFCLEYGWRDTSGVFHPYDAIYTSEPTKTRDTLVRAVVWYLDQFRDDPAETVILANGEPAVELSFKLNLTLDTPDGTPFVLCGHLDRLVDMDGHKYFTDRKAQPVDTKVLTPTGWTRIGDLTIGDLIAGADGTFTKVKGLYPKGRVKTYRVYFNDRSSVLCAEDHLWHVAPPQGYWRVYSTQEVIDNLHRNLKVPFVEPIQHPAADLELNPYLLGCLLGDGYLAHHTIQFSSANWDFAKSLQDYLPDGDTIKKSNAANYTWNITGTHTRERLKTLGLFGKRSADKFIPEHYLFSSVEQRCELLRGLLDTDGSWDGRQRRYQTMSQMLARGVRQLVLSLGGAARTNKLSNGVYRVTLRLPEHEAGIGSRRIKKIKQVEDADCTCIEVEASNGLYVTEHYIVTHNTTKSQLSAHYWASFTPNNQMSLYYAASQLILNEPARGGIIDAAQLGVNFARFARHIIHRTPAQQEEWLRDTYHWLDLATRYAAEDYWPMNDTACSDFGGCPFRSICSKDPKVRQGFLEHEGFMKKQWNPLDSRLLPWFVALGSFSWVFQQII